MLETGWWRGKDGVGDFHILRRELQSNVFRREKQN
jgi:hypothetical protein